MKGSRAVLATAKVGRFSAPYQPRQHQSVMVFQRTTDRIFSDQSPMLFLEFGSIFSRKNSKGRIHAVFEGGVCQPYTSCHSFCSWSAATQPGSRSQNRNELCCR